jgi:hypothetical protein
MFVMMSIRTSPGRQPKVMRGQLMAGVAIANGLQGEFRALLQRSSMPRESVAMQ